MVGCTSYRLVAPVYYTEVSSISMMALPTLWCYQSLPRPLPLLSLYTPSVASRGQWPVTREHPGSRADTTSYTGQPKPITCRNFNCTSCCHSDCKYVFPSRLIVISNLVLWLSPCWWWIPLHTKCSWVLSVGSEKPCSRCARWIPNRYTFNVLYEICCDAWTQKYSRISYDAGNGGIPNQVQNVSKTFSPDW